MNNKILVIMAMAIIGLGIGTIIGLKQIKSQVAVAQNNDQINTIIPPQTDQRAQYENDDLKEALKKSCFGTSINKKFKDSNMRCYFSMDGQFEGQQGIIDWQKGTKKEWEDKIVFPETSKEEMLIEEFTANDGSIWTVAVKPVSPNLAKAVEENLNDLIANGKYNQ